MSPASKLRSLECAKLTSVTISNGVTNIGIMYSWNCPT